MRKYLPNSKIVFDIGANVGDWTTEALNINPEIKLYCFEPSSSTFKILISRNFPPNVICKNLGFGSRVGKSILYGIGGVSSLSSLYSRQGLEHLGFRSEYTKELAIIDTVDNFCRENDIKQIDYLKLDVEGHELEVFKGMKELLKEGRVKIIQFEYGGCYIDARVFLVDIWNYIIELNPSYKFNKLYPKEIRLVPYYTQQLENFMLQNWALIKDE